MKIFTIGKNLSSKACLGPSSMEDSVCYIFNSVILSKVLSYLDIVELVLFEVSMKSTHGELLLDTAAEGEFNSAVKEHELMSIDDKRLRYNHKRLHGSSPQLIALLKSTGWSPMKKYKQLMYGPGRLVRFNRLEGTGLRHGRNEELVPGYGIETVHLKNQSRFNIAVANGHPMRAGKHYASFEFTNTNVCGESVLFEVGVMRCVSNRFWPGEVYPHIHNSNFLLDAHITMRLMNWERSARRTNRPRTDPSQWPGYVDRCTVQPRGLRGVVPRGFDGVVRFSYWDDPTNKTHTRVVPLRRTFDTYLSGCNEEAGLLLDLDTGILAYYESGMHQCDVATGLEGEYVFVVTVNGFRGREHRKSHASFQCRTY
jgi:hypothetical protein